MFRWLQNNKTLCSVMTLALVSAFTAFGCVGDYEEEYDMHEMEEEMTPGDGMDDGVGQDEPIF